MNTMIQRITAGVGSVVFLATMFAFAAAAWAQTSSTELRGLVRDSTGGVIPGADVTLTRVATGTITHTVTNEAGLYVFPLIEPGEYRVHVEMQGFRGHTVTAVGVQFQQRARVDIVLEIGGVEDRVEVVAGTQLLQTDEASVGGNIESERIVEVGYPLD